MSLILVTCLTSQLSLWVQLLRAPNAIGFMPEDNRAGPFLAPFQVRFVVTEGHVASK